MEEKYYYKIYSRTTGELLDVVYHEFEIEGYAEHLDIYRIVYERLDLGD